MISESLCGMILTKNQLSELLEDFTTGYVKHTDSSTSILPPFKKLGVLIDLGEIVEAKEKNLTHEYKQNAKTTQSQNYSCIQCRRNLPTAHLLDLHITEQHDSYFAAGVERGDKPLFTCYIEECDVKFFVPSERKNHCIVVHKFPSNYRFDQEKDSKCKSRSKSEKRGVEIMEVDADSMSASSEIKLPFIKAFSFGHPTQRTFNTRKERNADKALVDVQAMKDALNDIGLK